MREGEEKSEVESWRMKGVKKEIRGRSKLNERARNEDRLRYQLVPMILDNWNCVPV